MPAVQENQKTMGSTITLFGVRKGNIKVLNKQIDDYCDEIQSLADDIVNFMGGKRDGKQIIEKAIFALFSNSLLFVEVLNPFIFICYLFSRFGRGSAFGSSWRD